MSIKLKESNPNLDHKLKTKTPKSKQKFEFHTHQITNENLLLSLLSWQLLKKHKLYVLLCNGLLQNTYQHNNIAS